MSIKEEWHQHLLELDNRDKENSSSFPTFLEEFMDGCFSIGTVKLDEHADDLLFAPISPTNHVEVSITNTQEAIDSPTTSLPSFRSYNSSSNEVKDQNNGKPPNVVLNQIPTVIKLDGMNTASTKEQQQAFSISSSGSDSGTSSPSISSSSQTVTIKEAREIYDLQCHICSLNYKNPKVLPCLHSFCHACLENTIKYNFYFCFF